MAKVVAESTSPIWLSLQEARALVTETLLSRQYAEGQTLKWLWQGRIRWRWVQVFGQPRQGRSLKQEADALWANVPHPDRTLVDWNESLARKVTVIDEAGRVRGEIRVIGIRVARDDILQCLSALSAAPTPAPEVVPEPAPEVAPEPLAGNPSALEPISLDVWLRRTKRKNPQLPDETHVGWAKRLIKIMETDKAAGLVDRVWPQTTMERRLRDKDKDGDESYQLGN
jgi:hypothetical protein